MDRVKNVPTYDVYETINMVAVSIWIFTGLLIDEVQNKGPFNSSNDNVQCRLTARTFTVNVYWQNRMMNVNEFFIYITWKAQKQQMKYPFFQILDVKRIISHLWSMYKRDSNWPNMLYFYSISSHRKYCLFHHTLLYSLTNDS